MAHYTERHPKDKITEHFLEGMGFTLHKSCYGCEWHGHGQFFVMKEDVTIHSLQDLFEYFRNETYTLAYGRGKADALVKLYEKMNEAVFPPPEVNHDKLEVY